MNPSLEHHSVEKVRLFVSDLYSAPVKIKSAK